MNAEVVVLAGTDGALLRKYIELDAKSESLADAFEADVQEALALIAGNPFIGSKHSFPPFRKWLLLDWDMAIFYRALASRCFIHGVLSLRQDPEKMLAILRSRSQP